MEDEKKSDSGKEIIKAGTAATAGAVVGYGVVIKGGITAFGIVGNGIGFGAAAGPVGAVVGGVCGLAIYGLYRIFK